MLDLTKLAPGTLVRIKATRLRGSSWVRDWVGENGRLLVVVGGDLEPLPTDPDPSRMINCKALATGAEVSGYLSSLELPEEVDDIAEESEVRGWLTHP